MPSSGSSLLTSETVPTPETGERIVASASAVPPEASELRERYRRVTEDVLSRMGRGGIGYVVALLLTVGMMGIGGLAWGMQLWFGLGVSSLQHPIMWAVYITNFVWWIGIAHSGTMLSAILYLFRAPFRSAFARSAEAMTLIAIVTAGAFPIIHLGRAWKGYWLLPYPNQRHLWPMFRSPLVLDVFAVTTYLIVSLIFFWLGLVPDLAIIRDRSQGWRKTVYGLLSLGWEGQGRQWKHYLLAYSLLAGMATPLVISVHSVVSWDFSTAIAPGWHSTIFAPFFVIGAIFSGLARVMTLIIPLRALLNLKEYITLERIDWLARLVLMMSLLVSFCYALEYFSIWYGKEEIEKINLAYRATGPLAPCFWTMTACNSFLPLILFAPKARRNVRLLWGLSLIINVGMWLERFVVIAGSLGRDYLPYAWNAEGFRITLVETGIFIGSMGWFGFCYLLFARFVPVLPIAEFKRDFLKEHREHKILRGFHAEEAVKE